MRRLISLGILFGLSIVVSIPDAEAQNQRGRGAVVGGMSGAAIGGLVGGGRGAAIGTIAGMGVGSVMGSAENRRQGGHYWIDGRCWLRLSNGEFHPVDKRYCR